MGEAKPAAMSPEALEFFERLLGLDTPTHERELDQLKRTRPELYPQVLALVESDRRASAHGFLKQGPALGSDEGNALAPGQMLGAYRIERRIGAGGMGEVWLGARADGRYQGQVAIKVLHPALARSALRERFLREGQILANLSHPHIARLLDAGTAEPGLLFLVLEHIDGERIDRWCEQHALDVPAKLRLFLQVCEAVSHAHARLVVHRDLKPSNILVTGDGTVKLLDFGIAKLLETSDAPADATELTRLGGRALTPEYAAPEQVRGEPITTATDVYSLGVILFALLAGRRPYGTPASTAVQLERDVTDTEPRRLSEAAPRERRKALRGDLDNILAKALKKNPAERYASVQALADDLSRFLDFQPVSARPDSFGYRARKFLRRNRLGVAAGAAVALAIVVGVGATLWQAQLAKAEAVRATAAKDFLLGLIRTQDPRTKADKPRDQITAFDLLDIGAARLETELAGQPELQAELLYAITESYGFAYDPRYGPMAERLAEHVRRHLGAGHPLLIKALFEQIYAAPDSGDYAKAQRALDEADALITAQDLDGSLLRAEWMLLKASSLRDGGMGTATERRELLVGAEALFARLAPEREKHGTTIAQLGQLELSLGEYDRALPLLERALRIAEHAPDGWDVSLSGRQRIVATTLEALGRYEQADALYERSGASARRENSTGYGQNRYCVMQAMRAAMWHRTGDRTRAHALFDAAQPLLTTDLELNDAQFRGWYGQALVAEGRVGQALPLLEKAYAQIVPRAYGDNVALVGQILGDAYDHAGRTARARELLAAAHQWRMEHDAPGSTTLLRIRERWGRFLLDHSRPDDADFTAAEAEFKAVLATSAERPWIEPAQAHAGLSRIALAHGDAPAALAASREALAAMGRATISYDVRIQPQLWLVHSAALRANDDAAGAREWAAKALAASRRYDDPAAESIRRAQAALKGR